MNITVKTIKRNFGFKGIEANDLIIGIPLLFTCIILFALTPLKLVALIMFIIGAFLLVPLSVSKKNRMYKVFILIVIYVLRNKNFVYSKGSEKLNETKAE